MEQAARAEEIDRARAEKEGVLFKEWQDQEGQFHLEQARKRSEIRIKDNRANPIDLIAYYIYNAGDETVEITGEPLSVVETLNLDDLEDLQVGRLDREIGFSNQEFLFPSLLVLFWPDSRFFYRT